MTYQIKPTRQNLFSKTSFKRFLIFVLIAVCLLVFTIFGSTKTLLSDVAYPFIKVGDFFYNTVGKIPKFFYDKTKLVKENEKLLSELDNVYEQVADYQSLKYENSRLRQDLKIMPIGDFVTASVIAKPPQIPTDTLFLDRGFESGVNDKNFVLAGERIFIGRIVEVNKNKSTVALNSFAEVVSYGFVSRTGEPLDVRGSGGGVIETKVPIDFDIKIGDQIMTGGSLNYIMAMVGSVDEDKTSGFKNVLMSLPINVSKLNNVFVNLGIND